VLPGRRERRDTDPGLSLRGGAPRRKGLGRGILAEGGPAEPLAVGAVEATGWRAWHPSWSLAVAHAPRRQVDLVLPLGNAALY